MFKLENDDPPPPPLIVVVFVPGDGAHELTSTLLIVADKLGSCGMLRHWAVLQLTLVSPILTWVVTDWLAEHVSAGGPMLHADAPRALKL